MINIESMSPPKQKFTAVDLIPGQSYGVIPPCTDYDGVIHPAGESWRFVGKNFLSYEDGLSLLIEWDGNNYRFIMTWKSLQQADIIIH